VKTVVLLVAGLIGLTLFLALDQEYNCKLRNLFSSDAAAPIMAKLKQPQNGVFDFRGSTDKYERVCLVEVDEPGQFYFPSDITPNSTNIIGKSICAHGSSSDVLIVFAKSRPLKEAYVFGRITLSVIPKRNFGDRRENCAPVERAILQCVDAGLSGTQCGFISTPGE